MIVKTEYYSDKKLKNFIPINTTIHAAPSIFNARAERDIQFIVVHYTGNRSDTAIANALYWKDGAGGRQASAHFNVDEISIYQTVAIKDIAWHCGGKTYYHNKCRNSNSIGIEMCCSGDWRVSPLTKENTAQLIAFLWQELQFPVSEIDTRLVRHYDVTHKACPGQFTPAGTNAATNIQEWQEFKALVKHILNGASTGTAAPVTLDTPVFKPYKGIVTTDILNVRAGIGTNYTIKRQIKKGTIVEILEESSGWGRISTKEWVSLTYISKNIPVAKPATTTSASKNFTVLIITPALNVRTGPSTDYKINSKYSPVRKGTVLTITQEKNGWGKLLSGAGWISLSTKYVKRR